jgi:hypothetical protein
MTPDRAHAILLAHEAILFADCDPLVQPIVRAIAWRTDLPDEFLILDTYADVGDPPSVWHCETIRRQVREKCDTLGITMHITHTCLDSVRELTA